MGIREDDRGPWGSIWGPHEATRDHKEPYGDIGSQRECECVRESVCEHLVHRAAYAAKNTVENNAHLPDKLKSKKLHITI